MARVKFQLAWPAVGLSAGLPLLKWKREHNTTWEIPFIFSVTFLLGKYVKSPSSRKLLFAFASILKITLHATETVTQKEGFFPFSSPPYSQERSHLYLQPFKFRQVTKSLRLQTFQVVEMQVAVTQKITKGRLTDCNLKDRRYFQINPPMPTSWSPHISGQMLRSQHPLQCIHFPRANAVANAGFSLSCQLFPLSLNKLKHRQKREQLCSSLKPKATTITLNCLLHC